MTGYLDLHEFDVLQDMRAEYWLATGDTLNLAAFHRSQLPPGPSPEPTPWGEPSCAAARSDDTPPRAAATTTTPSQE